MVHFNEHFNRILVCAYFKSMPKSFPVRAGFKLIV